MPDAGIIAQAVVTIGMTLLGIVPVMRSRMRRFRRKLKRGRLWRLSEIPDREYGRIVGRAHPIGEALIAPMTGRRCVYYDVKVEAAGIQPTPTRMTMIVDEVKAIPFLLIDATGRAQVDPAGADVFIAFDARSDFSREAVLVTPDHLELFVRHGRTVVGTVYGTHLRYREAVIEVEDMITIRAAGTRQPDPDPHSGVGPAHAHALRKLTRAAADDHRRLVALREDQVSGGYRALTSDRRSR